MKKHLIIIPVSITLAIFFYPKISNSNSSGSVGGKTGSPSDGADCMICHSITQIGQDPTFTTDIPVTGYVPGNIYNITVHINPLPVSGPNGFEVTCEDNTNNTKAGTFVITDINDTKLTNNNNAVTHTYQGANTTPTWNFSWVAPIAGTGDITFYGAFIEGAYPIGQNFGDIFSSTSVSFNEAIVNSTINLSEENNFIFNSVNNTIKAMKTVTIFDVSGKIVLSTNEELTTISHLNKGVYIIKSENKTQKIVLN